MSDVDDSKRSPEKSEGESSRNELDDILGKLTESKGKQEPEKPLKKIKSKAPVPDEKPSRQIEPEGLEGILESITEKPAEQPVESLSILQRIVGTFTNPTRVFQYLKVKPDFLVPIILAVLMAILSGQLLYDIGIADQITAFEQNDNIPAERKDLIIDQLEAGRSGVRKMVNTFIIPPVAIVILYVVVTAIFLFIGNILLGGKAKFKQILSVYSYSYLIVILLGTLVKIPLILARETTKIDLSPAVFFGGSQAGTMLHNFVSSFDIFMVWFIIVFGLGFAIIYGFSKLKGVTSVIIAWLLYVVIVKVLLASVFQNILG